ncbi:MAG TPA: hypothetical protein VGF97_02700, partial [Rhizomicrobium sp.]
MVSMRRNPFTNEPFGSLHYSSVSDLREWLRFGAPSRAGWMAGPGPLLSGLIWWTRCMALILLGSKR